MSRLVRRFPLIIFAAVVATSWCSLAMADEPAVGQSAARLFPESTVAYVELRRADDLLHHALDPAAIELFSRFDAVQQMKTSGQLAQAQLLAGLLENRMQMKWPDIVRQLTEHGAHLGLDPAGGGPMLAFQAKDPEFLAKLNTEILDLVGTFAQIGGKPSPVQTSDHNGVPCWSIAPTEAHAIVGDLLVVSNKMETIHAAIDRWKDPAARSLADAADYQQSRAAVDADGQTAWALARMDAVRTLPQMQQVLESGRGNPVIEFAIGGIIESLKTAPFTAAGLNVDRLGGTLKLHVPRDAAQLAASRAWYFAPSGGQAAPPLHARGQIGTLSTYRDLGAMWNAREELFNEQVVAGLAQADSGLGLFFTGRDFGPEVLGQVNPRLRMVVAEQRFADEAPQPAIKLPAFALVLELKDPAEMSVPLLIAYQKTVGLANIVGGQQGQPQLLLATEDQNGVRISTATYVVEKETPLKDAPIHFNFSPSCATVGDRFVIGSTTTLVRDLVERLQQPESAAETPLNTNFEVDLRMVTAALDANREWFISNNMLTNGRTREQAATQIDALYQLLRALNQGSLRLSDTPTALELTVSLGDSR